MTKITRAVGAGQTLIHIFHWLSFIFPHSGQLTFVLAHIHSSKSEKKGETKVFKNIFKELGLERTINQLFSRSFEFLTHKTQCICYQDLWSYGPDSPEYMYNYKQGGCPHWNKIPLPFKVVRCAAQIHRRSTGIGPVKMAMIMIRIRIIWLKLLHFVEQLLCLTDLTFVALFF